MSNWYPLWYPPSEAALKAGADAVAKAQSIGAKTDRERDYIEAIASFYRDGDKLDNRTRSVAYEKAMEQVYLRYPDDREAGVFYALALDTTALPTDKTYANQEKAAKILQTVFAEQPNHPGAAHYLIHSYYLAPLADLGLPAAIRYSDIAPAVPHALHMPSHIFTRVGQWRTPLPPIALPPKPDRTTPRRRSVQALFGTSRCMRWITWNIPICRPVRILRLSAFSTKTCPTRKQHPSVLLLLTPLPRSSSPLRGGTTELGRGCRFIRPADRIPFLGGAFSWTAPMITYARALGAAHTGDLTSAQAEISKLQSARDALIQAKNTYWAGQLDVEVRSASAVLMQAQGKSDEALVMMRSAADLEDASDKHPVTPGSIVPARELLGDMLLDRNQPAEALVEYERSLNSAPNRFHGLAGAAAAAERAGDLAKVKLYREKLAQLATSNSDRPELLAAKQYLTKD